MHTGISQVIDRVGDGWRRGAELECFAVERGEACDHVFWSSLFVNLRGDEISGREPFRWATRTDFPPPLGEAGISWKQSSAVENLMPDVEEESPNSISISLLKGELNLICEVA